MVSDDFPALWDQLQIADLQGRKVRVPGRFTGPESIQLETAHLPRGAYLLHLWSKEGRLFTTPLILGTW